MILLKIEIGKYKNKYGIIKVGEKMKKYPNLEGKYIIETSYGCYTESGWCYLTVRDTLEKAGIFLQNKSYDLSLRIVDHYGNEIK